MTTDECLDEVALGTVLDLPETDPRRAHVQRCPRCRALALSYQGFVAATDVAGEGAADAPALYGPEEERRLTRFREQVVRQRLGGMGDQAESPWWRRLFVPAMRPAWLLAAAAVVVAAFLLWPQVESFRPDGAVRSEAPQQTDLDGARIDTSEPGPFLPDVEVRADGGARLAWSAQPDADRYEIRFYSTALAQIGGLDAGDATSLDVAAEQMPEVYRDGQVILVRVVALHGGDEIRESPAASLRRP